MKMRRVEFVALLLSLAGILAAFFVADRVFERVPHLEDEMAFVWQAKVFAHGELTAPIPPKPSNMWAPFVVNYDGHRFGKYPPGWPMTLALGIALGVRAWVNPFLGGLAIWLTFRLGQKIFHASTGLLAAFLTLTSPFFLINSGSLDSHPWSLALSLAFALAWMDTFDISSQPGESHRRTRVPRWMTIAVAGLTLGLLALTRPLTALGVALPFFLHGLVLLWRGGTGVRGRVLWIGAITLLVGSLFLVWQYAVTGNPFLNPYTLWWSYDQVGFGPGIGIVKGGHTLWLAVQNTRVMLYAAAKDLFGWGVFSWLFLPFGLWVIRRNRAAWLPVSVFASLVGMYMLYWVASIGQYGPRYYYESLYSLTLLSAAGILWLAGWVKPWNQRKIRTALVVTLTTALVGYNLVAYLPARLNGLYGFYGVTRSQLAPFLTSQAQTYTPALVFVHIKKEWTEYGGLLELEDPWLTTPFIFAVSSNPVIDAAIASHYPDRRVIHYYPDEPEKFYESPR